MLYDKTPQKNSVDNYSWISSPSGTKVIGGESKAQWGNHKTALTLETGK